MNNELEIHKSKQERKQIMNTFLKESSEQILVLGRFKGSVTKAINMDDLRSFPFDKWVQLNEKVKFKKIEDTFNRLVFLTEMKKSGEFGWHHHDDCTETCILSKGHIYCLETKKEASQGGQVFYEVGEGHIPIALEDSKFKVIFNKK